MSYHFMPNLGEIFTAAISHQLDCTNRMSYSDIQDGQCYRDILHSDFFAESESCNLTALLNTDGVPIFKSSGFSVWPILLVINELPYHLR